MTSGDGTGEQTDIKFNLMATGNDVISGSASPMLGQHLFRMESGEGLRSKPITEEELAESNDGSNGIMDEEVTDSDPSGLPE